MKVILRFPATNKVHPLLSSRQYELDWRVDHAVSSYGLGVLLFSNGQILDGVGFRMLRDVFGVWIETSDEKKTCQALGVPAGEPAVCETDIK